MERDVNIGHVKKQLPDVIEMQPLNDLSNADLDSNTLHLPENFSLSNYEEEDDDDSGFFCPCCLPR